MLAQNNSRNEKSEVIHEGLYDMSIIVLFFFVFLLIVLIYFFCLQLLFIFILPTTLSLTYLSSISIFFLGTIDWFGVWPMEALSAVARGKLEGLELDIADVAAKRRLITAKANREAVKKQKLLSKPKPKRKTRQELRRSFRRGKTKTWNHAWKGRG